jgi:hypothetical protein
MQAITGISREETGKTLGFCEKDIHRDNGGNIRRSKTSGLEEIRTPDHRRVQVSSEVVENPEDPPEFIELPKIWTQARMYQT